MSLWHAKVVYEPLHDRVRFRLALPTGAYYIWNGTALEGSPIEQDVVADFSWQERRNGVDGQFQKALDLMQGLHVLTC
jgi:hypothetical protein